MPDNGWLIAVFIGGPKDGLGMRVQDPAPMDLCVAEAPDPSPWLFSMDSNPHPVDTAPAFRIHYYDLQALSGIPSHSRVRLYLHRGHG